MVEIIVSPADDHEIAHSYASYMADTRKKSWCHTYVGARWELALARYLGTDVLEACAEHLVRVEAADPDDFIFDFKVGNVQIDAKSTRSTKMKKNNLLVTTARLNENVVYALGDLQAARYPLRGEACQELTFEAVGWQLGSSSSFQVCPFVGMDHLSMVERSQLIPIHELVGQSSKDAAAAGRPHIVAGSFKSDKYEWCPAGFVPLKITDPGAQRPLWYYSEVRRDVDEEFADDLQACLWAAGYRPECDFCDKPGTQRIVREFNQVHVACVECAAGSVRSEPFDEIAKKFEIAEIKKKPSTAGGK